MKTVCLINGEPGDSIPIDDRGLQYGDGLFETIAVRDGIPEFWERHMQRLLHGCERLRIPPPSVAQLRAEAARLQGISGPAVLKIIITRGSGGRGYRAPVPTQPTRILIATAWPEYPRAYGEQGVKLRVCHHRLGCNPGLAGMKHLNRLDQVVASSEWDGTEFAEGLMLNEQEQVIEGTFTNVFLVRHGRLCTPAVGRCGVSGIMRGVIMDMASDLDISCAELDIACDVLYGASEIFLTNSLIGIWPVRALGEWKAEPGPITRRLQKALADLRGRRTEESCL